MAEVVRYVDPDASGLGDGSSWANAYTSLSAWESSEQTNLVSDGDWHHVFCRSSGGTADLTSVTLDGWTTDATHYVHIEAVDGDQALKTGWDSSRYRLDVTGTALENNINYIIIDGLQIRGTTLAVAPSYWAMSGSSDIRLRNCLIVNDGGIATEMYGSSAVVTFGNCIVLHDSQGFRYGEGTFNFYNCVVRGVSGGGNGIYSFISSTETNVVNCAVFNHSDDFTVDVNTTIEYCASDDGDGTNPVTPLDWDTVFTDTANGDFSILSDSTDLSGAGIGPSLDSNVPTTDIDGDTRSGTTCDIGVDEFASSGGNTYSVECSDGINLSDSISSSSIISAILSDGMTASDSPASSINMNVSLSDSVAINDAVSTFSQIQAIMSELATFADSATTEKPPIEVLCSDSIVTTDSTESSIVMQVVCPDGIVLSDFAQAVAIIASSCSDGVSLTDTFIDSTFLPQGVVTITGYSAKLKITFNVVSKLGIIHTGTGKPTITGGNA